MKLCIFPGTFNPIHNAHMRLACYVLKTFGFDKIVFIPAYKPPHKDYDITMSEHRMRMVELAVKDKPDFVVSDIEFHNEDKSYTYNTIKKLYEMYDIEGKISLIIGTDAFNKIETWYETDKLKELVDFIVFMRENGSVNFEYLRKKGYNYTIANLNFYDISSTELRSLINEQRSITKFVDKRVEDYIKQHGLYGYKK